MNVETTISLYKKKKIHKEKRDGGDIQSNRILILFSNHLKYTDMLINSMYKYNK